MTGSVLYHDNCVMSTVPPPPSLPPPQLHNTLQPCSISHTTYIKEFPRNEDGDNSLHEAASLGQTDRLLELLERNESREFINRRDHLGCTPLRIAASGRDANGFEHRCIHTHTQREIERQGDAKSFLFTLNYIITFVNSTCSHYFNCKLWTNKTCKL